jgi:hypothetical protein
VKEGGEEKGSARGSVHWGCYYAAALKQVFICTSMVLKLRKEVEEEWERKEGECLFKANPPVNKKLSEQGRR